MFKLEENIRNIDSSDSEDGEPPRKKTSQSSTAPMISLPGKTKKPRCVPSATNPVFKKILWILVGLVVFGAVCFVSAPMLRHKFVEPQARSEPSVWWREATTTEKPEHLELSGGHYVFSKKAWGGVPASSAETPLPYPTPVVAVSTSEGDSCFDFAKCAGVVRSMQERHIAFNFLIGGDGNVYEDRGWDAGAEHVLTLCFLGDKKELLQAQVDAANELLQLGVRLGKLSEDYAIGASDQAAGNVLKVISKLPRWDPALVIHSSCALHSM